MDLRKRLDFFDLCGIVMSIVMGSYRYRQYFIVYTEHAVVCQGHVKRTKTTKNKLNRLSSLNQAFTVNSVEQFEPAFA